jgi:ABC-2 type transport system permease protein
MSTSTVTDTTATSPTPQKPHAGPGGRVTLPRVISAELIKLRTIRSTVSAALIAAVSIVAAGVFGAIGIIVSKPPPGGAGEAATMDPAGGALTGVSIAVYAIAALGVLVVTSEYATGSIKPTLAAVPRRGLLIAGKAIALAAVTFAVTLAATLTTFVAAQAVLATAGETVSLTAPGVLRAVVGAALYLTVVAVLGSGFGWLLRSTAGAIATLVAVLVLPPVIGLLLPTKIAAVVVPYLPDNAGTAIMQLAPTGQLGPWAGFAVFLGYAAVVLAGAVLVVRHRDA